MDTQAQIEEHNQDIMWRDAANHLNVAYEALQQAQSVLDDLNVSHISENLEPVVETVERFRNLALDKRD